MCSSFQPLRGGLVDPFPTAFEIWFTLLSNFDFLHYTQILHCWKDQWWACAHIQISSIIAVSMPWHIRPQRDKDDFLSAVLSPTWKAGFFCWELRCFQLGQPCVLAQAKGLSLAWHVRQSLHQIFHQVFQNSLIYFQEFFTLPVSYCARYWRVFRIGPIYFQESSESVNLE